MSNLDDILNQKIKQLDDELGSDYISLMGKDVDDEVINFDDDDARLTKPQLIDRCMVMQDHMKEGFILKLRTDYRRMKVVDLQAAYNEMKKLLPSDFRNDKKEENEKDALSSYYSSDDPIVINTNSNLDFVVPEIVDTTTTTTTMPVLLDTTTTTTVLPNNDVVVHNITSDHKSSGKTIEIKVGNDVTISIRL